MSKDKEVNNWNTYKRLLSYAMRYRARLFLGIFFGLITGSTVIGILYQGDKMLKQLAGGEAPRETRIELVKDGQTQKVVVDKIYVDNGEKDKTPTVIEEGSTVQKVERVEPQVRAPLPDWAMDFLAKWDIKVIDDKGNPTKLFIILSAIGLVIIFLIRAASSYVNRFMMRWVGVRVVTDLRHELFDKLLKQSMEFHGRESIGAMMSRCSNDIGNIQAAVSNNISSLVRAPMEVLAVVIFIVFSATKDKDMFSFMLVMLVAMPLSIVPVMLLGKRLKKYASKTLKRISIVMERLQEVLSCIRVVKAYNMEKFEAKEFHSTNENHFKMVMKAHKYDLLITPLMEFVAVCSICFLMVYCYTQGIAFNKILILVAAANFAYGPLKEIAKLNAKIQTSLAAADRIFEYLDLDCEIPEKIDAMEKKSFENEIVFENVCFSYGDMKTLDEININVKKGQFVAFVGEAGSGKSTLVNMLARFYDIHGGSIKIDGVDIRDIKTSSIHNLIGYVDQRTILFNNTVRFNVAYGMENATEEEIMKAVERADVKSFISEKEEGMDFQVGAKGIKLSGGQCQRVAIARTMLKNPPIMILDEATSALDNVTEQIVQKAINELMGDRTVLAIAHRLSTIKDADCIYVLDRGRIIEQGTHDELLEKDGQYAKMWNIQFNQ